MGLELISSKGEAGRLVACFSICALVEVQEAAMPIEEMPRETCLMRSTRKITGAKLLWARHLDISMLSEEEFSSIPAEGNYDG